MKSGRPVITTKLPGIPTDYNDYLMFFDGDSEDDMCNSLVHFAKIDNSDLNAFGIKAKRFVLENKNNIVQTEKILREFFKK